MKNNYFVASAEKAKREQDKIEQVKVNNDEELKGINLLIPASLHYAIQMHRVETGENMTQLIRRLLTKELLQ